MPKICDQECPGMECPYEVCPFLHEYTEKDEVYSGYRYVGDPAYDKKLEWAVDFKKNHKCETCPFVKHEVDIGVGIQRDCDHVCGMDIAEIMAEMEGFGV